MKKQDIITVVAHASVPDGSQLAQHNIGGGLTVAHITGQNTNALKVLAAQMFAEQLAESTADFGDEPTPELFHRLHVVSLEFYQAMIGQSMFEAVDEEIRSDYTLVITRLRRLAGDLKINYAQPEDPLVQ
jgi:hypothetical protein